MQLGNGTIDAGGEAEVVRIDDEAGSHEMVLRRSQRDSDKACLLILRLN
jgi:hypothetical protein